MHNLGSPILSVGLLHVRSISAESHLKTFVFL